MSRAQELIDQGRLVVTMGEKRRIWQGWCRHDVVCLDGREIGRVQVRQRWYGRLGRRIDVLTCDTGSAGVLGRNLDWLVRWAQEARP